MHLGDGYIQTCMIEQKNQSMKKYRSDLDWLGGARAA